MGYVESHIGELEAAKGVANESHSQIVEAIKSVDKVVSSLSGVDNQIRERLQESLNTMKASLEKASEETMNNVIAVLTKEIAQAQGLIGQG